jgi:hypothetical protein
MESFIVRCPSVTYARKGQKILEERGIPCRLTRATTHGCAWGLEIMASDPQPILALLEESAVIFTF